MNKLDSRIEKIIKKEGFYNDEIYYADYDSFEEIPLFSRWKSISFLKDNSFDENNKLLISHAISLAEYAITVSYRKAKEKHEDFFCCVTLTKWDDIEEINCITPNIYISRKKKWLFSYVKLKKTASREESLIMKYINELGLVGYGVYISGESSNIRRVYIISDIYSELYNPDNLQAK
jgi:hypothetical protein